MNSPVLMPEASGTDCAVLTWSVADQRVWAEQAQLDSRVVLRGVPVRGKPPGVSCSRCAMCGTHIGCAATPNPKPGTAGGLSGAHVPPRVASPQVSVESDDRDQVLTEVFAGFQENGPASPG